MRLLLVEDDPGIARFVGKGLQQEGFAVDLAGDGESGLHLGLTEPYDLVIADLMLPKLDGLTLIRELRRHQTATPVLILSARSSVDSRVAGLNSGADDYLVKPFAFPELLARVQALLRRASRTTEPVNLSCGDLSLNRVTRQVFRAGREIPLQPLEFSLLEYLLRNAGRVVSKTMIMSHVWDYNFSPQTNVVEARVCYLRDKVDKPFEHKLIHTVRGVGYVLKQVTPPQG